MWKYKESANKKLLNQLGTLKKKNEQLAIHAKREEKGMQQDENKHFLK